MKDTRGLYYFPFPDNPRVKMYVRQESEEISFRLWNADDTNLWDQHGWVPYAAIEQAAAKYKGQNFDPKRAYDIRLAKALLKEQT